MMTGLRGTWWMGFVSDFWYLPLAICIPPRLWVPGLAWVMILQFWVHTCSIRKMWWPLEYIFVTPSHHRLHHDRRLHKNYGSALIIWDRLFGTFQEETEHCKTKHGLKHEGDETCYFGVQAPIDSWTECVIQVQHWRPVFSRGIANFFKGPGWVTSFRPHPLPIVCPKVNKRLRVCTEMTTIGKVYLYLNYFLIAGSYVGLDDVLSETMVVRSLFMVASFAVQGLFLLLELIRQLIKIATYVQPNTNLRIGGRPEIDIGTAIASILAVVVFRKKLLGWSVTDHKT